MNNRNPKLAKIVNSEIMRLTARADQLQQSTETTHQALEQYQRKANQLLDEKYSAISQLQLKLNKLNKLQRCLQRQPGSAQPKAAPIVVTQHQREATLETALMRAGNLIDLSEQMDPVSVTTD